jgi:hypothetical protein
VRRRTGSGEDRRELIVRNWVGGREEGRHERGNPEEIRGEGQEADFGTAGGIRVLARAG